MNNPFIHKFINSYNKHYIYDVNSNKIAFVDAVIFDIIDDFGRVSTQEIKNKWKNRHPSEKLTKAINEINISRKNGMFSSKRATAMIPFSQKDIKNIVNSQIGYLCLNITESCNFRCKYCPFTGSYIFSRKHNNKVMSDDIIEKAIKYYCRHSKNREYRAISFYGGEPLLAFNKIVYATKFMKTFCKGEYSIHIDTNGYLLSSKEIIDFVVEHGCHLQISLDGPASIHDQYRRTTNNRPTFNRILKNLRLLYNKYPEFYKDKISFACTIAPSYDLNIMNKFFKENKLVSNQHLMVNMVTPFDTSFFDDVKEKNNPQQKQQFKVHKEQYTEARISNHKPSPFRRALFEKALISIHRRNQGSTYKNIPPNGSCIPSAKKLYVNTEGYLYPCERLNEAFCIGHIDTGVNVDKINNIIKTYVELSEKDCLNCWGVRLCGLCLANMERNKKFDIERKRANCRQSLANLHNNFVTYATIMDANHKAFDFVKDMIIVL